MSSLANKYGMHSWKTIYDAPENKEFRSLRTNPNLVLAGDEIFIPKLELKANRAQTEQKNSFVRRSEGTEFRLRLLQGTTPVSGANCTLTMGAPYAPIDVATDGEGWFVTEIPAAARLGVLSVTGLPRPIKLQFGEMDPIDTPSGVKKRLFNLGFFRGSLDDDMTMEAKEAVIAFARSIGLSNDDGGTTSVEQPLLGAHGT